MVDQEKKQAENQEKKIRDISWATDIIILIIDGILA